MTAVIKLNENLGLNVLVFPDFDTADLPLAFIKYQKLERVIDSLPVSIKDIVSCMLPLFSQHHGRYKILLDYKVRSLRKGETGCPLGNWHTDYIENPNAIHSSEEHLIFSTHIGTEFITTPMEVTPTDTHFSEVLARNPKYDFVAAQPNTVTRYSRLNLHRGPVMLKDCRRAVIRLSKIVEKLVL